MFLHGELDFLFKRCNKDLLQDKRLTGIPYYIPKWLGGLGMKPGLNIKDFISNTERRQAYIILGEGNKTRFVGNARTCLVHEKVNEILETLADSVDLGKTTHRALELNNGDVVSLEKENQRVYTMLVERVWKSASVVDLKTDIDEEIFAVPEWVSKKDSQSVCDKSSLQLLINRRQIYSRLNKNSHVWTSAFDRAQSKQIPVLPWWQLWNRPKGPIFPVVVADPVRDMIWRNSELVY